MPLLAYVILVLYYFAGKPRQSKTCPRGFIKNLQVTCMLPQDSKCVAFMTLRREYKKVGRHFWQVCCLFSGTSTSTSGSNSCGHRRRGYWRGNCGLPGGESKGKFYLSDMCPHPESAAALSKQERGLEMMGENPSALRVHTARRTAGTENMLARGEKLILLWQCR